MYMNMNKSSPSEKTLTFVAAVPAWTFQAGREKNSSVFDGVFLPKALNVASHPNKNLFAGVPLPESWPRFFCMYPSAIGCKKELADDLVGFMIKGVKPVHLFCDFTFPRDKIKDIVLDTRKSTRLIKKVMKEKDLYLKTLLGEHPIETVAREPVKYLKQFLDCFNHPIVIIPLVFPSNRYTTTENSQEPQRQEEKLVVIIRDHAVLQMSNQKIVGDWMYDNKVEFPNKQWEGWQFSPSNTIHKILT